IEIPLKKVTAIVGESGCGKTTFIKLILGLIQPDSGTISLDDINIKDIDVDNYRKNIGVVMQDGFLFNDSILKNIVIDDLEIDLSRLSRSIKISNLAKMINDLPDGLNTIIGSEGRGLSQGQKQRVLLARVIYKNPPIIILDEATSALD